jgi:hypothetical protein
LQWYRIGWLTGEGGMVWYDKMDGMVRYLITSWFKPTTILTNIILFLAAQLHDNFEEYLQNVLLRKKRSLGYNFSDGNRLDK